MAKKINSPITGGKLNNFLNNFPGKLTNYRPSKRDYLILGIALILLLAMFQKSLFIAALVNGTPISNLELQMKLNQQFRSQILNQLVNEKIIMDEARKAGAIPTEAEIDQKIAEVEANVGGKETLDALLSQQGQTRQSLRDQIKVQMAINKLYEKEASVSAEEVAEFIAQNSAQLTASDSAGQEKEAMETLKQQKISQIFNEKFQELRTKAKIQLF